MLCIFQNAGVLIYWYCAEIPFTLVRLLAVVAHCIAFLCYLGLFFSKCLEYKPFSDKHQTNQDAEIKENQKGQQTMYNKCTKALDAKSHKI